MADIKFTPDQLLAINTEGCDLLVSAAAGSGKTAVLTRRVLNKIIDSEKKCDITDFLVVTFTISAAADLKRKLSDGIREEMKREGADVSRLRRQLLSLSYAKIATIDSFCLFIVKDCLSELSLPVGMSIGDASEMDALALEIMEETVERFYSNSEDNGFLTLAETFSDARGDSALTPKLLEIYRHLINFPCPMELLGEDIAALRQVSKLRGKGSVFSSPVFSPIYTDITEKISQACEFWREGIKACELDEDAMIKYLPVLEEDLRFAEALGAAAEKSYSDFRRVLDAFAPAKMPAIRGRSDDEELVLIKKLRSTAKDIIVSLKEEYAVKNEDELFLQVDLHVKILEAINLVITEFHSRFMEEKRRRRIMSFSDMSHYAFEALIEKGSYNRKTGEFRKTPYAESLSSRFSEILIDEYQDVNELQDLIFRAVSNSRNRFMVGDIKQSIYAFRGATPKIFELYRDTFIPLTSPEETDGKPRTVFLQNNYRSDSKIIDFVNRVFSRVMNWEGEKYLDKDKLIHKRDGDLALPVEFALFDKDADYEEENSPEAEYIADEIIRLVKSGEYNFEDIAVLGRANAVLERVREALDNRCIPADSTGDGGYYESYEILTLISLLKAVANPTDDVYLASSMTTLPFTFTPDELYEIRQHSRKTDYYFALLKAAENESPLGEKCREFLEFIDDMRDFAGEHSCDRVLWRIIEKTGILTEIEKLPDSASRRENIISLYESARSFCSSERRSVGAFCDLFDSLAQNGSKGAKKQTAGAVKLMTFHASKGLQFPVTFVTGLGRMMNKSDSTGKIVFGECGPTFDLPYSEACTHLVSYLKKSASSEIKKGLINEELRTLYVTLTRAEKRLYVTAEAKKSSIENILFASALTDTSFAYTVKHASSHLSLIASALASNEVFLKAVETGRAESDELNVTFYDEYVSTKEALVPMESTLHAEFTSEDIAFAMKNVEVSKSGDIPYKISVSDIKEVLLDEGIEEETVELVSAPDFLSPDKSPSPAFKGTSMHTFMQFCSFELESEEDCRREAENLVALGFILPEHFDCLDFVSLSRIFKSELMKKIRRSPRVEREKRYTLLVDAEKLLRSHDSPSTDKVLVQGVIDCYFVNERGNITLVDFKTDRVKPDNGERVLLERHSEQLKLYAEALSEILESEVDEIYIYSFALEREIEVK